MSSFWSTPLPLQVPQGLRTTRPSPRQAGQVDEIIRNPCECITWPRPLQCWQTSGCDPGAAPVPPQVPQVVLRRMLISLLTPAAASSSVMETRVSMSPPRAGPRRPLGPPPLKMSPKMSEKAEKMSPTSRNPAPPKPAPGPAWPNRS